MKLSRVCVPVLSFVLITGCSNGDSGTVDNGGVIRRGGQIAPTTTVSYAFENFTGVSVGGPFSVSIVPGPYSAQVTVDSAVVDLLDVREVGRILVVGFRPGNDIDASTLDVQIVMPTLESINLTGVASGWISGFSGSVLDIRLAGISSLEVQNVSFDLLLVNAAGVSSLLMEDVRPVPAADLHLAGISSATVNMMDNAVITGSVAGISTLSYYGSNVIINVLISDFGSSVRRLGDSRP